MSIYTFSEAELRSRFIKNIGNRDDIDVYIEVPVFCRSVDLVIQEKQNAEIFAIEFRCLNCGSISIFEKNHAATSLFEDNRTEKCPVCGHEKTAHGASMQPELITPTMMKSLSNQLYTNLWSSAAQELRDATHIIFVGYSLPIADFEFRYMLQKNVTSSAKIDVILTPNSNPDLVANNLKDLLPSKRYLDAFPKNKVSFYYEGFGPYFSLSK